MKRKKRSVVKKMGVRRRKNRQRRKKRNELGRKSHRMNLVTVTADHQNRHRLVRVVTVGRTNRVNRINVYYCVIWLLYMPIV